MKTSQGSLIRRWRKIFQRRARRHDPLLVLSLAIFNSGTSWAQVFNPLKVRENVG